MNRLSATLLLLLAVPITFPQSSAVILRDNNLADGLGCPVGFIASRQAGLQTLSIGQSHHSGSALGLHLELDHRDTPDIESVEVTVYGFSPGSRVLPANWPDDQHTSAPGAISKTIELHRSTGSNSLAESDLWVRQFGVINWVDLTFITYTDGTTWQATKTFKCRSVPSNLLLIGQR
jgi:hypothetical protein